MRSSFVLVYNLLNMDASFKRAVFWGVMSCDSERADWLLPIPYMAYFLTLKMDTVYSSGMT
jgi:hypothetical protein